MSSWMLPSSVRLPGMRPQDLTRAETLAKISVVSNTAGGKKSVAPRSTGLDYSSGFIAVRVTPPLMMF